VIVVSEEESAALVDFDLALDAAREAFVALASDGIVFPAVVGHGSDATNRFMVKAATGPAAAGLKVGTYWPSNDAVGLPRHSSLILLFDQSVGRIGWAIEGGLLNAYRTAAADALAAQQLARPDSRTLAVFGTGHQAFYEVLALVRVRPISRVLVVGRSPAKVADLVGRLAAAGIGAEGASSADALAHADIVVTVTTATAPLFDASLVRPGTHVASMGSDGPGKHELPPELCTKASLFCDLPAQSRALGEFKHVPSSVEITPLGAVITGAHPGRTSDDEITVFDSSGTGVQDVVLGTHLLRKKGILT
jgi:ornithine cyclodeaminase